MSQNNVESAWGDVGDILDEIIRREVELLEVISGASTMRIIKRICDPKDTGPRIPKSHRRPGYVEVVFLVCHECGESYPKGDIHICEVA